MVRKKNLAEGSDNKERASVIFWQNDPHDRCHNEKAFSPVLALTSSPLVMMLT